MCGFALLASPHVSEFPDDDVLYLLRQRGPDSFRIIHKTMELEEHDTTQGSAQVVNLIFATSVLSLRGLKISVQPLCDPETGSVMCWNGEAWKLDGKAILSNDGELIFKALLTRIKTISKTTQGQDGVSAIAVKEVFAQVEGPYSFVFYHSPDCRLFYGRDILGRRSLLTKRSANDEIYISSVSNGPTFGTWAEVEADGIYSIKLKLKMADRHPDVYGHQYVDVERIPWSEIKTIPFPHINRSLPSAVQPRLDMQSSIVDCLYRQLYDSIACRLKHIQKPTDGPGADMSIAILFSGGVDCTVLAKIAHEILPAECSIDLLNVAFENPRVLTAAKARYQRANCESSENMPSESTTYSSCPDRMTGLSSFNEIRHVCPHRCWKFVAIDIPFIEVEAQRSRVVSLMYPHATEMDLSISLALYFAARGSGTLVSPSQTDMRRYDTSARVLLSGLGADELFGGYTRHATVFHRHGHEGLVNELELDINRISKRNLGRDDRVMSHWGKEIRYPYLDEVLVSWALECPIWEKCGYGSVSHKQGISDIHEPGKLIIRLLAFKLGMQSAAGAKKRAIQFGARTAKMVSGRSRGAQLIA